MNKRATGQSRRAMLAVFAAGLVSASVAQASGPVLRVERVDASRYPTLRAYVSLVGANGAPVSGLEKDKFRIFELKTNEVTPTKVQSLGASGHGVAVAVVFQASGIMEPVIDDIKKSVSAFLTGLGERDHAAVVVYSDKVETLAPFGEKANAASAVSKLQNPGFERLLWDGVGSALSLFPTRPTLVNIKKEEDANALPEARVLVVFGDGADTGSPGYDPEKVIAEAKKKEIAVYAIGHSQTDGQSLDHLKDLVARTTGGFAYTSAETGDEFGKAFGKIVNLVNNQYVLEWKADDIASDGGVHPLEVAVTIGGTTLRGSGSVVTPKWTNPVPWIVAGIIVLLLVAGGIVVYIKTRPEPPPVILCPVCKREQMPDWDVCLFCLKAAKATLLGMKGPSKGKKYPLVGKIVNIGKGPENFVKIPDPSVSTRHCGVQIDGTKFEIVDLGSSNGTYVNGKKVQRRFLRNGDILTLGQSELKFESSIVDADLGDYSDA